MTPRLFAEKPAETGLGCDDPRLTAKAAPQQALSNTPSQMNSEIDPNGN